MVEMDNSPAFAYVDLTKCGLSISTRVFVVIGCCLRFHPLTDVVITKGTCTCSFLPPNKNQMFGLWTHVQA